MEKPPKKALFLCFGFAAFAVFAMANVCQFADCRGKGNWRQNAMYTVGTYLLHIELKIVQNLNKSTAFKSFQSISMAFGS